ncbi:PAS domain S-box protein [Rhodopirellula baltica]|uniref:histidine kinase n=1 Tax=Rhodopirellula baltica WH47 TaxID=991778 RepID=F2AZW7_RHOBT|nr:PAS domain S-box protein [Rhodopirellula baltica]EGF24720.1 multi-sensor hybrid histidine kinase [Rhodopirellula baltica WH47]
MTDPDSPLIVGVGASVAGQEAFRLLAEASSRIVWIADCDGKFIEDSPSWRAFTGQTIDQLASTRWLDTVHPEDQRSVADALKDSRREGGVSVEFRLRRHDGAFTGVQVQGVPQRQAGGSIDCWVLMSSAIDGPGTHQSKQASLSEPAGQPKTARQSEAAEREAHLRRVINHQLGLVGVIDRDGILVEVDDRSLEIAKVAREDVIGKHFAEAPWWTYDPRVAARVREAMQRAFAGEVVRFDVSLFAYGDDGVRIDFMIAPVINDEGEVEFLIPSGTDIRDRHRAEVELRKSERLVRTIAENSTQGLVMMDATGHVIYCNQALLDMTGFDSEEIRSAPLHDLIHHHYPDGRPYPMSECPIDRALPEDFSVRAHEDLFFRKDGSSFSVVCAASPIFEDGKPVSTVIEVRDTTVQKAHEVELKRAAARLDKSLAFAGIAAWGWDHSEQRLILDVPLRRMWGFDDEKDVTLDDFAQRITPNHRDRVVASITNAMKTFSSYREEYTIDLPSGNQRWIRAIGQVVADGNGGIADFFGVTMDVTADLRRQVKARVRSELLEQLSELTDPHAIMQLATQRIRKHFSASRCYLAYIRLDAQTTEVFHESHDEHLSPIVGTHQIRDFLNDHEMREIESGKPVRIDDISQSGRSSEKVQQFADLGIAAVTQGSFEATKVLHRTLFITKDKPYRWRDDEVRFLDNLTEMVYLRIERAESQLELEQARAVAEAASQSKSAFVANMSHEIRTPMTAILGYADLVRDMIEDPQAIEHLETIRRNGDYLLEIINDILDLSKIEAGKLEVNHEKFEPARLIEDVRSIMEVRAKEGGLSLDVQYIGLLPKTIESDGKRLKQILINLVGNAIKFTQKGWVQIRVRFNKWLHIDIVDTGIGMSDEQQKRLFKPFSQGDASVTRTFGGTGLGLAISKRLTEMLGGTIIASSTEGVGSTFTVSVAVGDLADVAMVDYSHTFDADHEEISSKYADGSSGTGVNRLAGVEKPLRCHVLVVDDRHDIRFLSRALLTKAGATVDECEDGQLAVDYMTDRLNNDDCPDLILLDMQMPNLDGYETARTLRRLGYSGWIIALTADAMQGDMNECLEAGCNDYLSKPIDANRMIGLIAQFTHSNSDAVERKGN